ncbi:MAG: 50S ribosomal protein L11 methyltransferase [Helicobacteraceae bacterium]|nr:50S ribosomal protein L11 methyltransferase [Helicobacteraceae bacterium]
MNEFYFEICITPNKFCDLFISEIADFTNEAIEIVQHSQNIGNLEIANEISTAIELESTEAKAQSTTSIIIRTDKDIIDSLLNHLNFLSTHLSNINNEQVIYTHSTIKKENKDWINEYKNSITPIICDRFYIRPPWCASYLESLETKVDSTLESNMQFLDYSLNSEINKDKSKNSAKSIKSPLDSKSSQKLDLNDCIIDIVLEPSLAFGSGHHSTTFMCLQMFQTCDIDKSTTLLDVGCGSGILSLCANKLGAIVSLCDIDELSINEAKKNFAKNNATITQIWLGTINKNEKFDIVVANILASVIIEQKSNLISSLKDNGILILSGILDKYEEDLLEYFKGLKMLERKKQDEWICLKLLKI